MTTVDPLKFIQDILRNPQTGEPFALYPEQERFIAEAFRIGPDGRFLYPELLYSGPKKLGKSTLAAIMKITAIRVYGGRFAEGYCVANDLEQSSSRVFAMCARIVEASPALARETKVTGSRIEFLETGGTIGPVAMDNRGEAGKEPMYSSFDELWGYTSESAHRLWDEFCTPPTLALAARLTVTYAGFEGESDLLEKLYKRGLQGEEIAPDLYAQPGNMLMFWTHKPVAPWQDQAWLDRMRQQLRPNAYLRMIENRWVTTESSFVDLAWWDACVDADARPLTADRDLYVSVGVDASLKRDSTAIVVTTWDESTKKVRLIWHRIFQPSPTAPLDFEATIETTLYELMQRFRVERVRFDPWQMQAVAQRLRAAGLPMMEFPQSVPNLTESSTNLYELIKNQNIIAYADPALRLAVSRAVALETSRGWRITKEKASHKIDIIIALAMAALGSVRSGAAPIIVAPSGTEAPSLWGRF